MAPRRREKKPVKAVAKDEDADSEDKSSEAATSESDESDGTSEAEIEWNTSTRERRANAGSKMEALKQKIYGGPPTLNEPAGGDDEFYKEAYGGNFINENDDNEFNEEDESHESDIVDSDFDDPEVDANAEEDDDEQDAAAGSSSRQLRKRRGDGADDDTVARKRKKMVVARLGGATVAPNTVDDKTQQRYLSEALETEEKNVESLKRFEAFELEKRKRREAASRRRVLDGQPRIRHVDDARKGRWEERSDAIKVWEAPRPPKGRILCAVTGRPAKYRDPITGLPYEGLPAFRVIRNKYHAWLKTQTDRDGVKEYLDQFVN